MNQGNLFNNANNYNFNNYNNNYQNHNPNNNNYNNQNPLSYNKARYSMPLNPPAQPIKYPLMPNNFQYPNHDLYENQYSGPPSMQQMNQPKSQNNENFSYNGKKIENSNNVNFNQKVSQPKFANKPILIPQTHQTSEENLEELSQKHEQLISLILSDEEDVISTHRKHIDDMVETIKQVNN